MMAIPWDDHAVASTDGEHGRDIVVQGPLRTVVGFLAKKSRDEQKRILIAFPDRHVPPNRLDGDQIMALALQLERDRRAMAAVVDPAERGSR